ncbi:MAG: ethylbenzene dehydrogenase-related protein [Dehalococcoidales bacterium]
MKKIGLIVFLLAGLLLVSACQGAAPADQKFSLAISDNSGGNKNGAPILTLQFGKGTPSANTVVAKKGTPTIDGKDGDSAWGKASTVNLPLSVQKGGGPTSATVKAAYDENNIYFMVNWQDPTQTMSIHKNMMTYNAADKTWQKSGNEDRVYFLFNINATDFDSGCAVYCHVGNPDWDVTHDSRMGTNNPGEAIDVWHWKAHRTNPTNHAEDKHWVDLTEADEITYEGEQVLKTRLADTGDGFASGNSEAGLPKFMHQNDPGANVDFLFAGDSNTVAFNPNANWSDGDTVPGYILTEGTGSRADVIAVSTYSAGTWTVEFQRSLITNNPDDVQFIE